jgi:hypothetical protein
MAVLPLPAFPIDGPVLPESRQIGRGEAIDLLERRVVDQAAHQWLIGPRRIGKTSLAKAAADRVRRAGHIAIEIDLSRSSVRDAHTLASELARQARAAGVGAGVAAAARRVIGRRANRAANPMADTLAAVGADDAGRAVEGIAALLGAAEEAPADLDAILQGLAIEPRLVERRIMVLLDEVHLLREIGCEQAIANGARGGQKGLVFVFAGSEQSVIDALRTDGPLAKIGQSFSVPEIATPAWLCGLTARFDEIGVRVAERLLFEILDASDGQPRSTMLICSYVQSLSRPQGQADEVIVREAIRQARDDGSWT